MSNNKSFADVVSCETFIEKLRQELSSIAIKYEEEWLDKLYTFYSTLLEWNNTHNLTRITDFEDFLFKHLLDSLLLLKTPLDLENKTFCDVGSGAGFPGIPLSIFLPASKFTLIERITKKCSFLQFIKSKLNLSNVVVNNSDILKVSEKYDFISLRAVNIDPDFLAALTKNISEKGSLCLYLSAEQKTPNLSTSPTDYHFSLHNYRRKITIYSF